MTNEPRLSRSTTTTISPIASEWEWQYEGACRGTDPESFFLDPNQRGSSKRKKELAAIAICNTCPVIKQCLEHSLKVPEKYGVWGGLTEEQRYTIVKRRGGVWR